MTIDKHSQTLVQTIYPIPSVFGVDRSLQYRALLKTGVVLLAFVAFVSVLAQISFKIPTTTVPITGQTFGVLVAGSVLGSRKGPLVMGLYMLVGMFLFPVFAPSGSEASVHFIFPWIGTQATVWSMGSGGYIVGFIVASYVVGKLSEKGWDRNSRIYLNFFLGSCVIYAFGLAWLAYMIATNSGYYNGIEGLNVLDKTLRGGLYPFVGGDAIKLLLACMTLSASWSLVRKIKSLGKGSL
tara:strand:+ start:1099 stop:1815 length:717 start_codon:yes stop_codon:yes gene_type:complete